MAQHLEGVGIRVDERLLHAKGATELTVNRRIDPACKREGQRQCDAGIALDDVRVVPQNGFFIRIGQRSQRRDRTCLQDAERSVCGESPFDVLRTPEGP